MSFRIPSRRSMLPVSMLPVSMLSLSLLLGNWVGGILWPKTAQAESLQAQNTTATGTTCYWSTLQVGVYQEPNVLSAAVGVLPAGAIVLLGTSGQGWVRIQAPLVGWMTTTGLEPNPLKGCNGLGTIVPVGGVSVSGSPTANPSPSASIPSASIPLTPPVQDTPVLCVVVAPSGLPVRNQPILHPRTLTAILEPGLHQFQFSDRQIRLESFNQVRDWFYITAPVIGWISPRVLGSPTRELTGAGCP